MNSVCTFITFVKHKFIQEMKRSFITITVIILSYLASAQIIVYEDELIQAGNVIIQSTDISPDTNLTPGGSGDNQIWDFSILEEDETDSLIFTLPDSTPYAEFFPESNFAMFQPKDSTYVFLKREPSKLSVAGIFFDLDTLGTLPLQVEGNEIIAQLPMFYTDQWNSSSFVDYIFEIPNLFIDSARYKVTTEINANIDAWGKLIIPSDTFNVLRVHEQRTIYDSVWVKYAVFGWRKVDSLISSREVEKYLWWSDKYENGYSVCEMTMSPLSGIVESISYLKRYPYLSQKEILPEPQAVSVYPNPAKENISFFNDNKQELLLEIYSYSGKKLIIKHLKEKSETTFNISKLAGGIYIYKISGLNNHQFITGKFVRE